jgi:hypothetical protein
VFLILAMMACKGDAPVDSAVEVDPVASRIVVSDDGVLSHRE